MQQIEAYFPELSFRQYDQFSMLYALYKSWNEKINVISRKDIDNLYVHHVLHSLSIAKVLSFEKHSKIIDIGTGGGFPGIPLAILFPQCRWYLVDSINKKIKVVDHVVQNLKLKNVATAACRAENVKGTYDFVVSRAVTLLPAFWSLTSGLLSHKHKNALKNGVLYLKGGDIKKELDMLNDNVKYDLYDIASFYDMPYFNNKYVVHLHHSRK